MIMSDQSKNSTSVEKYYTGEKNIRMLVSLLKEHGIRKIVASPGTTNISFVWSVQYDPFFQVFSAYDERSAAYMAVGMAEESGEPVVLTCTGATASRNYVAGLTEAFYRKVPVLAVTATQNIGRIGQMIPQVLDRRQQMNDLVKLSVLCQAVHTEEDEKLCCLTLNKALLELRKDGGGPVHINLETCYSNDFSVKTLEKFPIVRRHTLADSLPEIHAASVGVFVGAHSKFSPDLADAVDRFCERYNGAVIVDHSSGYRGRFHVMGSLVAAQSKSHKELTRPDLLIHIGNISGAYMNISSDKVWRVNPDGVLSSPMGRLTDIFEMDELSFFRHYVGDFKLNTGSSAYYQKWERELDVCRKALSSLDLPFSNAWVARELSKRLPKECVLHLGILNSLRSWNFYDVDESIAGYSNTGGFGIDGCVSTMIGASLASPEKLFFGVFGDLAFFYDLNSLGNRQIGGNLRILLVNNGVGTEFKNYNHRAAQFHEQADFFIAARGHNGNKSRNLVRHYAEDLGFSYLKAEDKKEFSSNIEAFLDPNVDGPSIVFEVFTDSVDESDALKMINSIESDAVSGMKSIAKSILGDKGVAFVKRIL